MSNMLGCFGELCAKAFSVLGENGFRRNIERHNFLIYKMLRKRVASFEFRGRVLDLGCGSSPYRDLILKTADEYVGVDRKEGRYDHGGVAIYADLNERLPVEDASFDTVAAFQVLDDLPRPAQFVSECYRVLRPEGKIIITVPFMWQIHEEPYDFYRFTRYGLQYLLKEAGFKDIEIFEEGGFWQMWWLKFNYHTASMAKGPFRYAWYVVWWLTQMVAPLMDRLDVVANKKEPTHYAAQAVRPAGQG